MLRPLKITMTPSRREALWAYGFVSPWIVGFLIFTIGPMIVSFFLAFTKYNVISPARWVGLSNYVKILTRDPLYWQSLKVTFIYAAMSLAPGLVLGLGLAMLLNAEVPGLSIWRTIYYLPSIISGVAVAILWGFVFNPRFGVLNWMLSLMGIKGPGWLASTKWALPALAVMSLWGVGGGMILYLAGLQGIPTTLYDAAKVDGANAWHRFWHVTLPMISPVIFYNLVMGTIGTFQYFTSVYVLTDGGPVNATLFYNLYLYKNAFQYNHMGYASGLAWILFVIVLLFTLLIFRSSAAWVYYEGQLRGRRG
jgi:multiple sugar transport system permease protein